MTITQTAQQAVQPQPRVLIEKAHGPDYSRTWAAVAMVLALPSIAAYLWSTTLTTFQREYLSQYVRAAMFSTIDSMYDRQSPSFKHNRSDYKILLVIDRGRERVALPDDVEFQTVGGKTYVSPTDVGRARGVSLAGWATRKQLVSADIYERLQGFYDGRSLTSLFGPVVIPPFLLASILAVVAHSRDNNAMQTLKRPIDVVAIPKKLETQHCLVVGDAGKGKSTLLRQLLRQIRDRKEIAVVYEPTDDFLAEFYDGTRGDVVLP